MTSRVNPFRYGKVLEVIIDPWQLASVFVQHLILPHLLSQIIIIEHVIILH